MHQQFNIQQLYVLPTLFCIYLRTNSDLCHLQHKLIGFYNRDEKCLLRCTNWVFKQSSLHFVFKGLIIYMIYTMKLTHVVPIADAWRWNVPATLVITFSFLNFLSLAKAERIS